MKAIFVIVTGLSCEKGEYPKALGIGADAEEARCNAGYGPIPSPDETFWQAEITDHPEDYYSEFLCKLACHFHAYGDDDLKAPIASELKQLMEKGQFASAVEYCFDNIWHGSGEHGEPYEWME